MKQSELNYDLFGTASIIVKASGLNEDNYDLIDVGRITLKAQGREFALNTDQWGHTLLEDGSTVEISADYSSFEEALSLLDDCPFDLRISDLSESDLIVSVHLDSSADDNITNLTFISGEIDVSTELRQNGVIPIKNSA